MKRKIVNYFVVILVLGLILSCSKEEIKTEGNTDALAPVSLIMSTQGMGTVTNTQANAVVAVALKQLPQGSRIDVETTSPGGLTAPFLVEDGECDLTIANPACAYWAANPPGLLGRPVTKNVLAIGGGFDEAITMIVLTDEFVKKTGITSLEEAIAKKYPFNFVTKAAGSLGEATAKTVLEIYGTSYDEIISWGGTINPVASATAIAMLKDGKADISIDQTTATQANWVELSMTSNIHVSVPNKQALEALKARGFTEFYIPKGSFNGLVTEDLLTAGSAHNLLVSKNVDEEVVYLITKALIENRQEMVNFFAPMEVFDIEQAGAPGNCGVELHPGALRYYRERGFDKNW